MPSRIGPDDPEAVHEADPHDERRVPTREHHVEAVRALLHLRESLEHVLALEAPEEEIDLVAQEAREHRDRDHLVEVQVTAKGCEARQCEDGLALE
jgi:hypothetical protein